MTNPTHFCPECGCTDQPNQLLDLTSTQANTIKIFTIEKYAWVETGVYDNLYLIHDKDILARNQQELMTKLGEAKLLSIPVCPSCFTAMIEWEFAKSNAPTLIGIALENGKPTSVTAIMDVFEPDLDLLSKKGYGTHGFGPLSGILNGNNNNQIIQWLITTPYWNPLVAQRILEYAASYDWKEPKLSLAKELIQICLDNGADWQGNFPIEYLNRIIKIHENDADQTLFDEMTYWHFSRTVNCSKF